jgi:hypothetical protein
MRSSFWYHIVTNHLQEGGKELCPQPAMGGRPTPEATKLTWLKSGHNWQWPNTGKRLHCHLSSVHEKVIQTVFSCAKCEVGSCAYLCFEDYHIKLNWIGKYFTGQWMSPLVYTSDEFLFVTWVVTKYFNFRRKISFWVDIWLLAKNKPQC